ncbi:hypothetical protein FRC08_014015 [Ceratobasidium sp. 394]|nr:hypothetical protein FRC08_014015 [Ceratobasidium sp. 394]
MRKFTTHPGFSATPQRHLQKFYDVLNKRQRVFNTPEITALVAQVNRRLDNFSKNISKQNDPGCNFASALSKIKLNVSPKEFTRLVTDAITMLGDEISRQNSTIRAKKQADQRNLLDLRETAEHLKLLGTITLPDDASPEELDHLAELHPELFKLNSFCMRARFELHGSCPTCSPPPPDKRPKRQAAKYSKHPDTIPPVPHLFPSGPVKWQDVNLHHFTMFTGGTNVGLIELQNGELEVGIVVHVMRFEEMDQDLLSWFKDLAHVFFLTMKYGNETTNNGALNAGSMKVIGWSAGFFKGVTCHSYVPMDEVRNPEDFPKWVTFQSMHKFVRVSFNYLFGLVASSIVERTHTTIKDTGIPVFGDHELDFENHEKGLGSSFIVSRLLANQMHVDNDGMTWAFSLYLFIDNNGNLVTDWALIRNSMKGGYFIWPDLHLGIDPRLCDGVVMFLFRGIYDRHGTTTQEQISPTVTRYGCSLQVNKRLISKVRNATNPDDTFIGAVNGLREHIEKYKLEGLNL